MNPAIYSIPSGFPFPLVLIRMQEVRGSSPLIPKLVAAPGFQGPFFLGVRTARGASRITPGAEGPGPR